jgi:hypothetical protein
MLRALSLLSLFLCVSIVGCKSHDSNTNDDGGEDFAATSPDDLAGGGPDLANNDDGDSPHDSGSSADAGGVGTVICGTTTCDVVTNVCCERTMMAMTVDTCEAKAQCTAGAIVTCDGPEDCTAGDSCCVGGTNATTCETTCMGGRTEACHEKSECSPVTGKTVACCPITGAANLRDCRSFNNAGMVPANCN